MIPKIKKYMIKNKKTVTKVLICIIALIILLGLYKVLFYSSSEKATYGVRVKGIEEYPFTKKDISKLEEKTKKIDGIEEVEIELKGRLIKYFITVKSDISKEDIKGKVNEATGYITEKVKSYYDVTFYVKQELDGKDNFPIIGYKHKNRTEITFDEL